MYGWYGWYGWYAGEWNPFFVATSGGGGNATPDVVLVVARVADVRPTWYDDL